MKERHTTRAIGLERSDAIIKKRGDCVHASRRGPLADPIHGNLSCPDESRQSPPGLRNSATSLLLTPWEGCAKHCD